MQNFIKKCQEIGELKIIDKSVDINLEIAHISYIEAKKPSPKVLLFTNVKNKNKSYDYPVLTNTFASKKVLEIVLGRSADDVGNEIKALLNMHMPNNFFDKINFLKKILNLKNIKPKRLNIKLQNTHKKIFLKDIPVLKTWQKDGGEFITMGQVYTRSLDGKQNNLGLYRMQIQDYEKGIISAHFQLHKDANHFFYEYEKANKKMPLAIAIGDDPLYILSAQAPLPKGIFELLLYGFIKKRSARLVKCSTCDIWVPQNSDFIIEGFIDPKKRMIEGPFGDHTGFYTKALPFPFMQTTAIWGKEKAIYQATVVGKPPLEDRWMGYATERFFLPLLQIISPDVIDYKMPENGVFHNLILIKIKNLYPGHITQIMHSIFGTGQLSFVKHIIFLDENAPKIDNYDEIFKYVLNIFEPKRLIFSQGIADELDHSSDYCFGSKLSINACKNPKFEYKEEENVYQNNINYDKNQWQILVNNINLLDGFIEKKIYFENLKNEILCIKIKKEKNLKTMVENIKQLKFELNFNCFGGIVVFFDENAKLENPYFLIWRLVNNIDAKRDIFILGNVVFIDACKKYSFDGFTREWPQEVKCDEKIIKDLHERKILDNKKEFYEKFEIF